MKCKRCSVLSLLISALIGSGNVSVSVYLGLKSIVDTLSITVLRSSGDNSIETINKPATNPVWQPLPSVVLYADARLSVSLPAVVYRRLRRPTARLPSVVDQAVVDCLWEPRRLPFHSVPRPTR